MSGGTGSGYTLTPTGTLPPGVAHGCRRHDLRDADAAGRFAFAASATDTEGRTATYPVIINVAAKLAS